MRRTAILTLILATSALAGDARVAPPNPAASTAEVGGAIQTSGATHEQKLSDAFPEVARLFDSYVERQHMRGAAIGIIAGNELVWTRTAGLQSLEGKPFALDTRSRIASMTKSFTAAAILKLRDEGKLHLDDPAAKYVPELAKLTYPTSDAPAITIRHLLTHSEGFPEDNPWGDRQLGRSNETMSAWMKAGIPFSTTPGTAYEYSNYGFAILGQIVERVSGIPYDAYVRKNLLDPLGMTATTFHETDVPAEKKAIGYRWQDERWVPEPILPHGSFGAMGGLWTTIPDLTTWVKFLLSAYPPRSDKDAAPLKRSSRREMQELARFGSAAARRASVDSPILLRASGYGYGLGVTADCRFRHIVSHGGGLPGYGSLMLWLPDHGVGIVFMSNRTYGGATSLFNDVLDALRRTGALEARPVMPAKELLALQAEASKLLTQWSGSAAERLVGDNFFLDNAPERWMKESGERAQTHGVCTMGAINPENALRGTWRLTCERGFIDVAMTLTPQMPPRIQYLSAASVLPPDATLSDAVAAALRGSVPEVDQAKLRRQLEVLQANWGSCRATEPLRGDGKTRVAMKLACDRGTAVAEVELDPESRKVTSVNFTPFADDPCVP